MIHPLLNPDSKHYDTGEKPLIYKHEQEETLCEARAAAKSNIRKYKERLGKKTYPEWIIRASCADAGRAMIKESDLKKIETWENYLKLLDTIVDDNTHTVRYLLDRFYPDLEYTL